VVEAAGAPGLLDPIPHGRDPGARLARVDRRMDTGRRKIDPCLPCDLGEA
jgi:hypothetical protein